VTGETAGNADFNATNKSRAPIVFAFVLGLAFILLLLTFRSIVIPIQAILQPAVGWCRIRRPCLDLPAGSPRGSPRLPLERSDRDRLPLFLFTVLFGLSMDYHVFILSRIKELVDRGVPTEEAVERGIRSTASTVTSAALVMVAVFSIFDAVDARHQSRWALAGRRGDPRRDDHRGVLLPATMSCWASGTGTCRAACTGCRGSTSRALPARRTRRPN
jgi:RND superfamily putative drug exporter